MYNLLGISGVMARSVREELWAWEYLKDRCIFADQIPITLIWTVWKEMNRKAFDDIDDVKGFNVLKNR